MFDPRDYKNVEEYIASLCTSKRFNGSNMDEEMKCREAVLKAFEEHKKALAERSEAKDRKGVTFDKDKKTIKREQKEFKRADKTSMKAFEHLKDSLFRIVDLGVDVEFGSDPDRLVEIYIERMLRVDEESRKPKQSDLSSRLAFHVDESEAIRKTEESKKAEPSKEDPESIK